MDMINVSIQWICDECGKINYGINTEGRTVCGNCGHPLFDEKYLPNYLTDEDFVILNKLLY